MVNPFVGGMPPNQQRFSAGLNAAGGASTRRMNGAGNANCPCHGQGDVNSPAGGPSQVGGLDAQAMQGMMSAFIGLMGMMMQVFGALLGSLSGNGNPLANNSSQPATGNGVQTVATGTSPGNPGVSTQVGNTNGANQPVSTAALGNTSATLGKGQWTRPNQMQVFDASVRESACGPAAAIGLARSMGINVSPQQALQLAGGNFSSAGMGQAQVAKLARDMGVPAYNEEGAIDWDKVKSEAMQGKKVVLHFEGHYYFVEGYDPATGKFDLGTSVTQFRAVPRDANGRPISQYTQDEIKNVLIPALSRSIPSLTAKERGAIYIR